MSLQTFVTTTSESLGIAPTLFCFLIGIVSGYIFGYLKGIKKAFFRQFNIGAFGGANTQQAFENLAKAFSANTGFKTNRTSTINHASLSYDPPTSSSSVELDGDLFNEVAALVKTGNKIEAVKKCRELKNLSLTEAKQVVDALEKVVGKI